MSEPIRVLLADDHPLIRAGIRFALSVTSDIDMIADCGDGLAAQQLCRDLLPDILLLDLNMPGPTALETITNVQAHSPETKILILTAHANDVYIRTFISKGVTGYILKDEALTTVVQAIRSIMEGGTWFSQSIIQKLIQPQPVEPDVHQPDLSPRDRQLLNLVARGWDNARIAAELSLAEQTIRNYLTRIYDNLHVHTRIEAMIWTRNQDWFEE